MSGHRSGVCRNLEQERSVIIQPHSIAPQSIKRISKCVAFLLFLLLPGPGFIQPVFSQHLLCPRPPRGSGAGVGIDAERHKLLGLGDHSQRARHTRNRRMIPSLRRKQLLEDPVGWSLVLGL